MEKTDDASLVNKNKPEEKAPAPEPLKVEDIKLPEGFVKDETTEKFLGEFVNLLNAPEKTPAERAQGLVDLQSRLMEEASVRASEQNHQNWTKMQEDWQAAVKADPTVGGDKLDKNLAGIGKLFENHTQGFETEFRAAMDMTGAGNNPHVIKFLHNIAEKLNEPEATPANPGATATTSLADALYPSMKK